MYFIPDSDRGVENVGHPMQLLLEKHGIKHFLPISPLTPNKSFLAELQVFSLYVIYITPLS